MRDHNNAILSRWAKDALKEYERVSGGGVTHAALIPLLMASLGHLADQMSNNGKTAFDEAFKLYTEEAQ